ncbi:MAG TPA: recombinase family protein [Methylomirabilota bacterium]
MRRSEKIRPEHLARPAFVYVRQSTVDQVRHHHESRRRQYDLAAGARALGWQAVVVIDEDLGKSGATIAGRTGFQRLVADVSLGRAGAVFSLEVSRLARNNRDWHQLLELCGLTDTVIVDADGIYDPRLLNDRLLLGLKGTISEAELGWLRQRAYEGLLAKARRGELRLALPVGYIHTPDGQVAKHPDQRVQAAIGLVFQQFATLRSARQVLLWFHEAQLTLPVLRAEAPWGKRVSWRLPRYNTILTLLRNPVYAGAYAFGRTTTRTHIIDGAAQKTRGHRRPRADWLVLLPGHHDGYIAWDTYAGIQQLLADNAQMTGQMAKGAVRAGPSVIAGLLRCGRCGRRLQVTYSSAVVRYSCRHSSTTGCGLAFGGLRVDAAIERELVRVLTPGAIETALATADRGENHTAAARQALDLELREARYEAERAQRQYDAVEPEHRLVAVTLEQRWNAALERVATLEQRVAHLAAAPPPAAPPDRATLLALAQDFPAVWAHPETDIRAKKHLVRLLIEEIVASVPNDRDVELLIHWKGGRHTRLLTPRNRTGQHRRCTDRGVVDVVRDLARRVPDAQIARLLNRLGYRTGAGNSWTQQRVISLRHAHDIPVYTPPPEGTGPLTIGQAAHVLGVSTTTVRKLIVSGRLPATQPVPYAPWAIRREDLDTTGLHRVLHAVRSGRPLPRTSSEAQLPLINSQT